MTKQELFDSLDEAHHGTVQRWLDRGDGVAVYENAELGHPDLGHKKFVSFGSAQARLEPNVCDDDGNPPQRMPDIGGQINWRYQLTGTVRA